ncbi:MAG: OmpA family protein [Flavobacteriales bacterium]|jgi:chemotaxis protein MotB|nr:OmpA family protein [Flavobacteriales bacterium]
MNKLTVLVAVSLATITACVPARKFEELEKKEAACSDELKSVKAQNLGYETENAELKSKIDVLDKSVGRLKSDTTLLGKSLRMKERQYDKIDALNMRIQKQLEDLQRGSTIENQRLMNDLNATRLELQRKEDELNRLEKELKLLEAQLNKKEATLNQLSADLKSREQRVKELEDLIASKDAAVNALKDKVAAALLGFKDKGLTVEQKNGRVYVSMEAKLLFPSGSTKINTEGKSALISLAKVLQDQQDLEVLVEGHTDTDKMNASTHPKNNWELSVLRATSVVEIMLGNSSINPATISAAGRSQYLPVDPNDKAKNRRIEVILIPNLDELFEIISK